MQCTQQLYIGSEVNKFKFSKSQNLCIFRTHTNHNYTHISIAYTVFFLLHFCSHKQPLSFRERAIKLKAMYRTYFNLLESAAFAQVLQTQTRHTAKQQRCKKNTHTRKSNENDMWYIRNRFCM